MERFRMVGSELVAAVEETLAGWLSSHVAVLCGQHLRTDEQEISQELEKRLNTVTEDVTRNLRRMASAAIDEPVSGPLEQIRSALVPLTDWLQICGATPNGSPDSRPDDPFGFGPVTFRDLSDEVHDAGIRWGAAKAFMHQQHRSKRP